MSVIRALMVKLGVQSDDKKAEKFERAIDRAADAADRARQRLDSLASSIKTGLAVAAGVGVGGLVSMTSAVNEQVTAAAQWGAALDVPTSKMMELGLLAEQVGIDISDVADVMYTSAERMVDAMDDPASEAGKMMRQMGIDLRDTSGNLISSEEIFYRTADALAGIENPAQRAARASILLGDVGVRALPMLNQGGEGIRQMGAALRETGAVLDEDGIQKMEAFRKAGIPFRNTLLGIRNQLVVALAPGLTKAMEALSKWAQEVNIAERVGKLFEEFMERLPALFEVAKIIGAVLAFQRLVGVLRSAVLVFRSMRTAALMANAAILVIPAAVAAIYLIIEDIDTWLKGGPSLIGQFIEKFEEAEGPLGDIARWLKRNKAAIGDFINTTKDLVSDILSYLYEVGKSILQFAASIWDRIKDDVLAAGRAIIDAGKRVGAAIGKVVDVVRDKIIPAFKRVYDAIAPTMRKVIPWLFDAVVWITTKAIEFGSWFIGWFAEVVADVIVWVIDFAGTVGEYAAKAYLWIMDWYETAKTYIQLTMDFTMETYYKVAAFFSSIPDRIKLFFLNIVSFVLGIAEGGVNGIIWMVNGIIGLINSMIESINDLIDDVPGASSIFDKLGTIGEVAEIDLTSDINREIDATRSNIESTMNNSMQVGDVIVQVGGSNASPAEIGAAAQQGVAGSWGELWASAQDFEQQGGAAQ